MSTASNRHHALRLATSRSIRSIPELAAGTKVSDIFGLNTFNVQAMKEKLPRPVFESLQQTIRRGAKLNPDNADEVAHAVKEWALEKGATHFCHWFQPQTGLTAEKHDAFLTFDNEGNPMERFSGFQLIQSEPDASSFPSGGARTTFEARGYTAWDPSSPIFIIDGPNGKTLCIPSAFVSYHGDALDNKTPLLRSMEVLSEKALAVLRLFGDDKSARVVPTVGPEQEYFLVDRALWALRPDLVAAGRTLIGARPPKGQELDDHYFGSIKDRALAFMQEAEHELYKLGIPIKTRHNEVAPSQYETAPIFEEANVASDNNQIVMETMRRVALRHDLQLLLHEKPFAGVNGSGKHCNWSLMDSGGRNLLEPGETPEQNLLFLIFLTATLSAVHRRAGLLRAAIACSGNDHRLGANEAPPAIISVFLGQQLTKVLDSLEKGEEKGTSAIEKIRLGIQKLPELAKDNTDRNRTSPFAFTGNKFEFRAVPSSVSISTPVAYLNAAVAEALEQFAQSIEEKKGAGATFEEAAVAVVKQAITDSKAVRFEGNNYADEWVTEAESRGLLNLRTSPEALAEMVKPDNREFMARYGVLSAPETDARFQVRAERYVNDLEIEVEALKSLVSSHVLPAAYRQLGLLAQAGEGKALTSAREALLAVVEEINDRSGELQMALEHAHSGEALPDQATRLATDALPAMLALREACDKVEESVSDEFWALPKYQEMLFLS